MKRLALLLVMLFALGLTQANAQQDDSFLRFVHAIPGVGAVDVYLDGDLSVVNLGYGTASNYIRVETGTRQVVVRPTGLTTELWRQQIGAPTGTPQTLIASGIDPLEFRAFEDDFSPIEPGITRLRLIHAIEGAPAVDVTFEDTPVVSGLNYGASSGGFDIQAGIYPFTISAGGASLATIDVSLVSSTSHVVIIYGTPNSPQVLELTAPTNGNGDFGFVRIAHTADAPAVDVYVEDLLIAAGVNFGDVTEHLRFPAGTYAVSLSAAGTNEILLEAELTVEAGVALTVAAVGDLDNLTVNVFVDDVTNVAPVVGVVSVVNTIPDSTATVTLADGTALGNDVAFNSAADAVSIDPTSINGTLTLTIDGQSQDIPLGLLQFYGGVYVNAFVVLDASGAFPQPRIIFAPTALAQSTASAPGAAQSVVVEVPQVEEVEEVEEIIEEEVEVVEVVEETTEAPEVSEATEVTEVTEVTVGPTPAPAPVVAVGPTAQIQLNPDANLNLRQFPSANALVLGQAPSGVRLLINGRAGAPIDLEGNLLDEDGNIIEPEDYVDPIDLLEEGEDLDSTQTWLNITYNTPDGGQIIAWINAQFVLVRDERGNLGALRDLETVPANQPGEAINTSVRPPSAPLPRTTVRIINLNPGVNLNIRRTPETTGEILFGIPLGTVTALEGVNESREWAFIEYQPPQGGTVNGWISLQFAELQLNGTLASFERLEDQELLVIIPDDQRGTVTADAPRLATPTQDPTRDVYIATVQINPGANLNLRRTPNAQAEVVAQIPSQTQVIVTARTIDEAWVFTSYEGISGWVASNFVSVTFNGVLVNLTEIPLAELDTETETESAG